MLFRYYHAMAFGPQPRNAIYINANPPSPPDKGPDQTQVSFV